MRDVGTTNMSTESNKPESCCWRVHASKLIKPIRSFPQRARLISTRTFSHLNSLHFYTSYPSTRQHTTSTPSIIHTIPHQHTPFPQSLPNSPSLIPPPIPINLNIHTPPRTLIITTPITPTPIITAPIHILSIITTSSTLMTLLFVSHLLWPASWLLL